MSTDTTPAPTAADLVVAPPSTVTPARRSPAVRVLDVVTDAGARLARPLDERRGEAALVTALVVGVLAVHVIGVFGYPSLADDEGTYTAQADMIRSGELTHYTYWYDHPPLGWIQIALVDWIPQALPGVQPVAATRLLMVLAAGLAAGLFYLVARRLEFSPAAAAAGVLLGFCSPLAVTLQRQVYLDNVAVVWLAVSFVLVLDRRHRLWVHVGAGATFAVAVLSKETLAPLLVVLAWAVYRRTPATTRWFSVVGLVGTAVLAISYYPLMALLRRELLPGENHVSLWDALMFQAVKRPGSGAIWSPGAPAHEVLQSWLFYDRWLILAGLVGLPVALAVPRLRMLGACLGVVTLMALKPGGYLPAMYIIVALPLLGLVAAGAADVAGQALWRRARQAPAQFSLAVRGALATVGVAAVTVLGVAWWPGLATAMTADTNSDREQAEQWLDRHLPSSAVVLTDDVTWVTLVNHELVPREQAIWFYKLDTDPEVSALYPGGWRDVDYVVSTSELRQSVAGSPSLLGSAAALKNSRPVAVFGDGPSAVEIRQVAGDAPEATP